MGCLSFAKRPSAKAETECGKNAQAKVRKPRRPDWVQEIRIDEDSGMRRQSLMDGSDYVEPAEDDSGILFYIRVAGVDVDRVMHDPFMAGKIRTDFVCIVAESFGTLPSCVRDFHGNCTVLSDIPCHPSQGLVFGGFLPTVELHKHHGKDVVTIKDILAVLHGEALAAKLKAAAAMPQYSLRPDGSIHFDFFAVQGAPDPPKIPGKQCPWDLWVIAWDLWSIVPPPDIAGDPQTNEASEIGTPKTKDRTCSDTTSDYTSHLAEDHPDTLLSHRSAESEVFGACSVPCLPEAIALDCESRKKLARLLDTMSGESRGRCRPGERVQRMSGERPPQWWLKAQPLPGCTPLVRGPCWCATDEGASPELLIKEGPCEDAVFVCAYSNRSGVVAGLGLPTSHSPQPGAPTEGSSDRSFLLPFHTEESGA